jgi:hypothetical protein
MNRFSGDITPAFASGNRGMQPLTDEQERLQRLLEAIILKTPGGVAKSIGEGIQTGVDVVGSIGQLDKAEQLGRQARRTLPDIVSAVTEQPGAVASALGRGLEQDILDKGAGAFIGVEDAFPMVGKAGKFMGGIGAAAMMSKMPKMSKQAQDIVDASKPTNDFYDSVLAEMEDGPLKDDLLAEATQYRTRQNELAKFVNETTPAPARVKFNMRSDGSAPAQLLLTKSAKEKGKWQGTIVDEQGPMSHISRSEYGDVVKELSQSFPQIIDNLKNAEIIDVNARARQMQKTTANVSKPAITDRGRRNVELAQEQIAAGETPGALVKAKIAESNAETEKIRKEIQEIIPEEEEQYRFNIILNQFKNGETTEYELLRQLSDEFIAADDVELSGQGPAKKLYDLAIQENVLELRTLDNDFVDQLDVAEKARLDRAVKQGFDIDAFHGTKGNIESFDPGLLGATTDAPSARRGFFFSADPETATVYADLADAEKLDKKRYESFFADKNSEYFDAEISNRKEQIQRAKSLGDKNAVKYLEEELQDFELEKKDYLERQVRKRDIGGGLGENIMPVKLQITNPFVRDFEGDSYRDVSYNELLATAEAGGYDGAIFKNTSDGAGVTDIYVVFDPSQIRSRYATFDPQDAPKGLAAEKRKAKSDLQSMETAIPEIDAINAAIKSNSQDLKFAKREYDKVNYQQVKEYHENNLKRLIKKKAELIENNQEYRKKLFEYENLRKEKPESGDLLAGIAPILYPVGVGAAAAAYTANEE